MKHLHALTRSALFRILLVLAMMVSMTGCSSKEPESGEILSGRAPKNGSEITVTLEDTGSSVVILEDADGDEVMRFYVRSGDTVTVDVPAKEMYVTFASGTDWENEDDLFGDDTVYRYDNELTDFSEYAWEYEIDPMDESDLSFDNDEHEEPAQLAEPTESNDQNHIAKLEGNWEKVHLQDGNSSLNVSAQVYGETIRNCTEMTINMEVSMNAGTKCKDWQIWLRIGGTFVKKDTIYLEAGDGATTQTVRFSNPVSFDAIAITPTVPGGYSWSMGLTVTDVWMNP